MEVGQIVRATGRGDGLEVTRLYRVAGRVGDGKGGCREVRVAGVRGWHPAARFAVLDGDDLAAIDRACERLAGQIKAKHGAARVPGREELVAMVLLKLEEGAQDGEQTAG